MFCIDWLRVVAVVVALWLTCDLCAGKDTCSILDALTKICDKECTDNSDQLHYLYMNQEYIRFQLEENLENNRIQMNSISAKLDYIISWIGGPPNTEDLPTDPREKHATEFETQSGFVSSDEFNGSSYSIAPPRSAKDDQDAVKICENLGGQFAEIDSEDEHEFVKAFVAAQPGLAGVFISGRYDMGIKAYIHQATGIMINSKYTNFADGEPNPRDRITGEFEGFGCTFMDKDAGWRWSNYPSCDFGREPSIRVLCELPLVQYY